MDGLGVNVGELAGYGSGWVIVSVFVIAILRGRLVPRSVLDDSQHEAQEWRAESRIKDQQIQTLHDLGLEKDRQIGAYSALGQTVTEIMTALHDIAKQNRPIE